MEITILVAITVNMDMITLVISYLVAISYAKKNQFLDHFIQRSVHDMQMLIRLHVFHEEYIAKISF